MGARHTELSSSNRSQPQLVKYSNLNQKFNTKSGFREAHWHSWWNPEGPLCSKWGLLHGYRQISPFHVTAVLLGSSGRERREGFITVVMAVPWRAAAPSFILSHFIEMRHFGVKKDSEFSLLFDAKGQMLLQKLVVHFPVYCPRTSLLFS